MRWEKELATGFYYKLLADGFIKPEDQEPDIDKYRFYFDAFRELSTARPVGLAVGPIPFTAIVEYFKIYGENEDFEDFIYIIRGMDLAFLEINAAKSSNKKEDKTDGKQSNKTDNNKG